MEWIENIIDKRLEFMSKEKFLMMTPDSKIPAEMLNLSIKSEDDWKGWKPIESKIQNNELEEIENKIGFKLPDSYKALLKYKHFYELILKNMSVHLFSHISTKWKKELNEKLSWDYFEDLIEKKFFHFADLDDWGMICFDGNKKHPNNEYEIVVVDHEDSSEYHFFAKNLKELLESDENMTHEFITKLNQKRDH